MDKPNIANWLQIAANLGILAGLVLVALQISQTNTLTGYQLNAASYESFINTTIGAIGENPELSMYRVILEPDSATDADYFIADHIYRVHISQIHRLVYLADAGLAGNNNFQGSLRSRASWFACPYGIAYLDDHIGQLQEGTYRQAISTMRELAMTTSWSDGLKKRKLRLNLESTTPAGNK